MVLLNGNSTQNHFIKLLITLENQTGLCASRINRQVKRYVSWHPEPEAMAVNAFSLTWSSNYFYMLLSFSAIDQVLAKVNRDKNEAVIVVRNWSNQ